MIASLVATLTHEANGSKSVIEELASHPEIETGEFDGTSRRIPLTIDSASPNGLETITRWLQDRPGIAFVDVIFVHFEATTPKKTSSES